MSSEDSWLHTDIGGSTADSITLRGRDLARDLMGKVSFSELAFLLVVRRLPTAGELGLLDAVLVSLTDHGLTPTVLAARLTHTGAPESLQGAIAAGLLGGGSVYLGPTEDTARFLSDVLAGVPGAPPSDGALEEAASAAVRARIAAGERVPGLGHPIHKVVDPRVPRLYAIAEEGGLLGPHLCLLRAVAEAHAAQTGRRLPVNGAGAAGAALADLGVPPSLARGFALLARTAGLVAHLGEEMEHPLGPRLYAEIDDRVRRAAPPASAD
ncbi:MAG: citryl-CoA lyase [Chloroflexi bacterium]|nr:MAG: citryl-CoA lyase [Chloroflexota bacterium]